ncbi:MAG: hypothetical protein JW955_12330, partial [Sedimentisphaerales bacterium]|nr:hypothetical protein [Sedimentisphaerales bacterium]
VLILIVILILVFILIPVFVLLDVLVFEVLLFVGELFVEQLAGAVVRLLVAEGEEAVRPTIAALNTEGASA